MRAVGGGGSRKRCVPTTLWVRGGSGAALPSITGKRGELDLEDAILKFEEGQKLHRGLMDELGAYEKRLEKLVRGPDGEDALTDVGEE